MKNKVNYIIILLFIIFFSLACSCNENISENFISVQRTEKPISLSDMYTILNDCIDNIRDHDTKLHMFDSNYKMNEIKIKKDSPPLQNIQNVLNVMKIQDNKISELLSTYVPNSDLDGLISGKMLEKTKKQLYDESHYTDTPVDCDPDTIREMIKKYNKLLEDTTSDDEKKVLNSMIGVSKLKLADLETYLKAPGNTKCIPALTPEDADNILNGYYANHMVKIINSQKKAIQSIQTKEVEKVLKMYSAPP